MVFEVMDRQDLSSPAAWVGDMKNKKKTLEFNNSEIRVYRVRYYQPGREENANTLSPARANDISYGESYV